MEKIDKLLTIEQASKQLHISPRTLNNDRNTGTGVVIAHTGEVRGLLDMVSTEKNTFTHTGKVRGLLDMVSTEKNTLNHTGEVKGLLD
jgi:hypothetical protein|tara:strand:+ start:472 stop:735 length:264 start_codon:yes stop_codon:yes gene_type:complete